MSGITPFDSFSNYVAKHIILRRNFIFTFAFLEDIFINPSLVTAVLLIANFGLFIVDRILCRPLSLQDTGWEESDDEALFLSTSCVPKLFPQLLLSPSPATHLGMGLAQLHEILKRKTTTYTASFWMWVAWAVVLLVQLCKQALLQIWSVPW